MNETEDSALTAARAKALAEIRLERAIAEIDEARKEASGLEGKGYADIYDRAGAIRQKVDALKMDLARLAPPTGYWTP
jgi:hypothetical protein